MKTLSTPLSVHDDSVIDSDYFEQDTSTPRKHKPHTKRADHKHKYACAWLERTYIFPWTGETKKYTNPITYCTVCGRIGSYGYNAARNVSLRLSDRGYLSAVNPKPGAIVFRGPKDGNILKDNRINLDNFYIQQ